MERITKETKQLENLAQFKRMLKQCFLNSYILNFVTSLYTSATYKLCKCSTCCYFKTAATTEFAAHHAKAKSAGWCSDKRHCYSGGMWRMHPPHQPFSNMFLMNTVFP